MPSGNALIFTLVFFVSFAVFNKVDKSLDGLKDGLLKTTLAWGGALLWLEMSGSIIALIAISLKSISS